MKLALLVLACFVCLSKQERYIWPLPIPANQAIYKPLFYSDGLPAGYDIVKKTTDEQQNVEAAPDAISRSNASPLQNRFFLASGGVYFFTATTSITSTVTSTVTTATVVKCIPSTQFASTTACARRRRNVEGLLADISSYGEAIEPDLPKPLEATAMVENFSSRKIEDTVLASPEIVSSQKEEPTALSPGVAYNPRAFTTTKTSIAFVTTYQFVPTSITSTLSLGASTGLLCLPSGFSICA